MHFKAQLTTKLHMQKEFKELQVLHQITAFLKGKEQ